MRVDKLISNLGLYSRKETKKMARNGRICVNGKPVLDSAENFDLKLDELSIDGVLIDTKLDHIIMLNKPMGYVTASQDAISQTVFDLLPEKYLRLNCMPVGRLDKDTHGLLLFTTDGELNHRLCSPKYEVSKTYRTLVTGKVEFKAIHAFEKGVVLKDFTAKPAELIIEHFDGENTVCRVSIKEGKYHQVRRMFAALGHTVLDLERLSFGNLSLDINLGDWRELSKEEEALLKRSVGLG